MKNVKAKNLMTQDKHGETGIPPQSADLRTSSSEGRSLCDYGIPMNYAEYIDSQMPCDVIFIREGAKDGRRYALRPDFKIAFDACRAIDPDTKLLLFEPDKEGNVKHKLNPAILRVMVRLKIAKVI